MIKLATQYLKEHKPSLPYKYIIIDEFQDTSLVRFNLIQEILHLTNALYVSSVMTTNPSIVSQDATTTSS